MDRSVSFGFNLDYISSLAGMIEKECSAGSPRLSGMAFVFGGRRPELFLKKELSSRIKKSFIPPKFFSMEEFVDFILSRGGGYSKINGLEACYMLYSLAGRKSPQILKGREDFASFLPWARQILAFIEQLDLEDIRLDSLKSVEMNAAIGFDVPDNINALLANIIGLRKAFHDELRERKLLTRGMRYLMAAGLCPDADFSGIEKVIFCNLFYLHSAEKKIIRSLLSRNMASLVFQGSASGFTVLKDLHEELGLEEKLLQGPAVKPALKLYSCFDAQSQAAAVRQILSGIKDPDDTVIVLPETENLVALLSEISQSAPELNVSMGYPLKKAPLFSLFSAIFKAQNSRKDGKYYSPDYLALLTHPLAKNFNVLPDVSATRMLVHKTEEVLLGMEKTDLGASIFVGLSEIEGQEEIYSLAADLVKRAKIPAGREQLKDAMLRMHELLFYSWEEIGSFKEFSLKLKNFCSFLLENSYLDNYPLNLKILQRIIEISEEMESAGFSGERFPREDIFKIFLDALSQELVSFSGSPLKGLQILGLFETRALNFKNVIIMDVNESALPDLKIYEPLIPREVMLNLGLNRLEKEEEIQRYQFQRLILSAQNVYLLFEEGRDKEKSRFIEELVWEKQKESGRLEVMDISHPGFRVEVMAGNKPAAKNKRIADYLARLDYSVTGLNTYLKCPLKFYYRYVLNLEEKLDILEEPEGRQIGNFIHSLLEEAFKRFLGQKPVINAAFKKYFFAALDKRFEENFQRTMRSGSFMLKEIIRFRMERFLELEKSRDVSRVFLLEEKSRRKLSLPGGREINFVLKIDRVDELKDGSFLILDYKTGAAGTEPKPIEKINEGGFSREALKNTVGSFQMPLYLYFLRRELNNPPSINAAIYNLRSPKIEYFLKGADFSRISGIEEVFIRALEAVIMEILDPGTAFAADTRDARYCRNCPFFYLCR